MTRALFCSAIDLPDKAVFMALAIEGKLLLGFAQPAPS
jgi:hypothetical protein